MAKYQYKVKGVDYDVEIEDIKGNIASVTVNGIPFEVEMKKQPKAAKPKFHIDSAAQAAKPEPKAPAPAKEPQPVPAAAEGANAVTAPLPGTINDIKVKVGDQVKAGDTVVVLEAMKMQNNIEAETAGTIASVNVAKGDAVNEGDTLVTIKNS